jgi:hypothetical protein
MIILVVEEVMRSKYLIFVVLTTAVTQEAETVESVAMSRMKVIIQRVTTDLTVGVSTKQMRDLVTKVITTLKTGTVKIAAIKFIIISPAFLNKGLKICKNI